MKTATLVLGLALLTLGVASAQVLTPITFSMDTAFVVGNTTLPAGSYEIVPTQDDINLLELRAASGKPSVLFEVDPLYNAAASKSTELQFNKYGNNLVLKNILVEGQSQGDTTVTTPTENRHRKASGKPSVISRIAKKVKL